MNRREFLINTGIAALGTIMLPKVAKIVPATEEDMKRLDLNKELTFISRGRHVGFVQVTSDEITGYTVQSEIDFPTAREAFNLARFLDPSKASRWDDDLAIAIDEKRKEFGFLGIKAR